MMFFDSDTQLVNKVDNASKYVCCYQGKGGYFCCYVNKYYLVVSVC